MTQYEIWWARMPAPVRRRPVLLLSRPEAYMYLNKLIAVEVTTTIRGIPQEILLGEEEGMPAASVACFDNLHVVGRNVLEARIGRLARGREVEVKRALGFALSWPELVTLP